MGFLFGSSKVLILATHTTGSILGFMEMFTGDMENWLHHVEIDDTRHAAMLKDMLSDRDFSDHEAGSNIRYTFEMMKWVADHYEYLTYANSDELEGGVLPAPLKSLIAHSWAPAGELRIVYPIGSHVSIKKITEVADDREETTLEKIVGELGAGGRSFDEILADTKALIEIDENLIIEQHQQAERRALSEESFILTWTHPLSFESGIDFVVKETDIYALPFGTPEHMHKLFPFSIQLNKNLKEKASIVSELAVLGAEHCMPRVKGYFTDRLDIENFAARLKTI